LAAGGFSPLSDEAKRSSGALGVPTCPLCAVLVAGRTLGVFARSCEVTAVRADWWVTVDRGEVASNICWLGRWGFKPLR